MSEKPRDICQHDPCWCGEMERTIQPLVNKKNEEAGFRPWTQEAHDKFMSNEDKHRR